MTLTENSSVVTNDTQGPRKYPHQKGKAEKADKEILKSSIFEFLEIFSANGFTFFEAKGSTSGPEPLNRGGIADLPLLRTLLAIHQKSREPGFWQTMASCFISIYKFGSCKNSFPRITSLSKFHCRCRRSILLVQMKEMISMSYDNRTSC